jgi:hypothetical protein
MPIEEDNVLALVRAGQRRQASVWRYDLPEDYHIRGGHMWQQPRAGLD